MEKYIRQDFNLCGEGYFFDENKNKFFIKAYANNPHEVIIKIFNDIIELSNYEYEDFKFLILEKLKMERNKLQEANNKVKVQQEDNYFSIHFTGLKKQLGPNFKYQYLIYLQLNRKLKLDNLFKTFTLPLSEEEYSQLAKNILNGEIRIDLYKWHDTLIFDYNIYRIVKNNNIKYEIKEKNFEDEETAIKWVIEHQLKNRKMSKYQQCYLVLKLEPMIAAKAKRNQKLSEGRGKKSNGKVNAPINTIKELEKILKNNGCNVSHDYLYKVKKINREAKPEIINKLISNELTVNKVFKNLKK